MGDNWGNGYNIDYWPVFPAAYEGDNIITVGNLMFNGELDESSNFGLFSVDIAAPGTYVLSTTPGGYGFMSGTSMAAPMVTGVAAMVYSCRTDLSLADVRQAILTSARPMESLTGKGILRRNPGRLWGYHLRSDRQRSLPLTAHQAPLSKRLMNHLQHPL